MDRYSARMNLHGATQRERAKTRLINNLNNKLQNSLFYKDILLNGEPTKLIINTGTQPYYKEFESLPEQDINIGDYIEWANSHWIVVTCDSDNEIYKDGKLNQCNYLLKWQNEQGKIIERWAVIQSASKYNDGTDGNNILTVGSDQLSIIIPLDKESIKLKKSMGVKFFIDNNKENPTAYELTGTGNVPDTYDGHGITSWIVKECAYTASELDLKYGVCNYKTNEEVSKQCINKDTALPSAIITGNGELKTGFSRTYIAEYDGKGLHKSGWNIVSNFDVSKTINGDKIELYVNDVNCIGSSFLLQFTLDNAVVAEMRIVVVAGF